jgi:hypothetical protein
MNSSLTPRLLVGTAAGLGPLLLAVNLHGLPFGGGATPASAKVAVRVDQVGYVRGETKQAYVMGPSAALAGARFEVVDARNKVVTAGRLGAVTGRWNAKYPSVRTADLSALNTPGTYRIVLTGTAAGHSPAFRIAGARDLMTPLVQDNVRFLQAQRDGADVLPGALQHGPSHLADQDATVYADPEYDEEGTELLDERLTPAGDRAPDLYRDLRRQVEDGVAHARHDPFGAGAVYDDFDAVPHTFGLVATARLYARATGDTRYAAFAGRQRGWALGANPWGTSFMIGAGEVYPHCPEHQLANLAGSHDGKGAILRGAVVNGPNAASKLEELNSFPTMKKCTATPPAGAWTDFDGKGARYVDDVGAWQTVEPSLDFTTTALLAFALTAQGEGR